MALVKAERVRFVHRVLKKARLVDPVWGAGGICLWIMDGLPSGAEDHLEANIIPFTP